MKDKKNIVIIILTILVVVLGGYIICDKAFAKKDNKANESTNTVTNNNNEKKTENTKKTYELIGEDYVGLLYSGFAEFDWPTESVGHEDGEPDKLVRNINIPKINIETSTTNTINNKILSKFENYIALTKQVTTTYNFDPVSLEVNYTYTVLNGIIFIDIHTDHYAYRASGHSYDDIYYYDMENDKELTYKEVLKKLGLNEEHILRFIYDETKGTDSQKIQDVYPVMANTELRVFFNTEEIYDGIDIVDYSLL